VKVKFLPQDVEYEIKPNQSVMHVAQDHELFIKSVCKGVPSCAECRVRLVEGEYNVLPPGSAELALIGTGHFIDRRRLSCQLKCFGDIVVDLSEQVQKQKDLTSGAPRARAAGQEQSGPSHAITGNLLEQDPLAEALHDPNRQNEPPPPVRPAENQGRNQGRNQGGGRNQNQRGGQRNAQAGPAKTGEEKSSGQPGSANRSRNSNRRNRRPRPPK
jgi:2Fe-2S ferredoxin